MTSCLIESLYLPNLAFFKLVGGYDVIFFDVNEKYTKQTYRNRTKILMSNKVADLIIPIKHSTSRATIGDVEVDFKERWNAVHWKSIKSSYGKTPYFEHYAPFLEKVFQKPQDKLVEINLTLLKVVFSLLQLNIEVKFHSKEKVEDLRGKVHSKKCELELLNVSYSQAFGTKFVEDLSILDVLFNHGPQTLSLIANSSLVLG